MNIDFLKFLQNEINENKISHAFLVETNSCEKLLNEIGQTLINNDIVPNQSLETNISISIIRPENNLIDKNKILDLQKFIMTKSVIKKYKIYIIINSELMNLSSFNKLLKILEEPTDNVIGFLLTENTNLIISTIRSRCKKFKKYYEIVSTDNNIEIVNKLLNFKNLKFTDIIELKKQILQNDKYEIINIISIFKTKLIQNYKSIDELKELAKNYKILDNIIDLIKSNVNTELCLDKMFIEMRK